MKILLFFFLFTSAGFAQFVVHYDSVTAYPDSPRVGDVVKYQGTLWRYSEIGSWKIYNPSVAKLVNRQDIMFSSDTLSLSARIDAKLNIADTSHLHNQIVEREEKANKNATNGYAGLDSTGKISTSQLGSGTADNTKFLRGDRTWAVPPGGGGGGSVPTGTGFRHVVDGVEDAAAKLVENADVAANAAIAESKLSLNFPTHSNANDPTAGEKAALAGTSGTPSGTNKYVTDSDPRNTNARTPTAHAGTHESGGGDEILHDNLVDYNAAKHREIIIGILANRPNPGVADRFFYATDTKELFYDDGFLWNLITTEWTAIINKSVVNADVSASAAIAESKLALNFPTHARQHALNSASDHTGRLPFTMIDQATAGSRLLGRGTSGSGDWEEISLGTGLSMSGTSLNASGGGLTVASKTADESNSTTTGADISNLTVSLSANQVFHFHAYLVASAAATTTGIQLGINGPSGAAQIDATIVGWTSTTAIATTGVNAYETYQANTASAGTSRRVFEVYGVIVNGSTAGTFALRFKSEVAGSAVTIHRGSWIQYF